MPKAKKAPIAAPVIPDSDPCEVENILPGTNLSLGDGRSILFGEKAIVTPDVAAFLRERGQVA